jgi:hypothetical protein
VNYCGWQNTTLFSKEDTKMVETKKDGLFKRLFGGKKAGCCDVKIEEVEQQTNEEKPESTSSSGCCSSDNRQTP